MPAEPFEIAIPEEKLSDLRTRLERINWAPDFDNDDWSYGVNGAYLKELADHWLHEYDWRAHEAEMNAFANFRVEIEGMPIHFVHERGKGPNPMPIILSHGWPWTYWGPPPRDRAPHRPGSVRSRPGGIRSMWSCHRSRASASPHR